MSSEPCAICGLQFPRKQRNQRNCQDCLTVERLRVKGNRNVRGPMYDHARQNTAYRLALEQARALLRNGSPTLALAVLDDVVSHVA